MPLFRTATRHLGSGRGSRDGGFSVRVTGPAMEAVKNHNRCGEMAGETMMWCAGMLMRFGDRRGTKGWVNTYRNNEETGEKKLHQRRCVSVLERSNVIVLSHDLLLYAVFFSMLVSYDYSTPSVTMLINSSLTAVWYLSKKIMWMKIDRTCNIRSRSITKYHLAAMSQQNARVRIPERSQSGRDSAPRVSHTSPEPLTARDPLLSRLGAESLCKHPAVIIIFISVSLNIP